MQKISSARKLVRESLAVALLTALVFVLGIVLKRDGKSLLGELLKPNTAKADAPGGVDASCIPSSCASNSTGCGDT